MRTLALAFLLPVAAACTSSRAFDFGHTTEHRLHEPWPTQLFHGPLHELTHRRPPHTGRTRQPGAAASSITSAIDGICAAAAGPDAAPTGSGRHTKSYASRSRHSAGCSRTLFAVQPSVPSQASSVT